jgi:hypothetical protein
MTSALNASRTVLASLLSQCDDNVGDHLLWVSQDGRVYLEPLARGMSAAQFEELNAPELKFRLDVFRRGEGYVGLGAAKDQIWVNRLFLAIDRLWAADTTGFVKSF